MSAQTTGDRAKALVIGLTKLQEREVPPEEQSATIQSVATALKDASTVEGTLLKGLITAQQNGLTVPLRFQLLVKNLNSFRVMAQKVGFKDLNEALTHDWK